MARTARWLGELYPFASHYLEIDGHRMHYVDEGRGPVVLMLHGNPTWSFYYRDLIRGLRGCCRVVAPDHIGCGLSDKPQRYPYTLATHIKNVGRLIEHLDLSDITLAVHDWGGAIGLGWATRHVDLVRGLVLFNTAAYLRGVPRRRGASRRSVRDGVDVGAGGGVREVGDSLPVPVRIRVCGWPVVGDIAVRGLNAFARAAVFMACKRPGGMGADVRRGYLHPYHSYRDRVALLGFVRDIPLRPDVPSYAVVAAIDAGLARLRALPVIAFWGMRDFCFHAGFLAAWIERFPGATVHRFEDAGHYVVEDAHARILPRLREFVVGARCADGVRA
ncbi:MAG: alpha/beta fold hydrolase [Phycisphaerae bacterium]